MKLRPIEFYINENGCHICISHKRKIKEGYPIIERDGKCQGMIRYLWEQKYGKIPNGLLLCHKCDNPSCINIDHGFLGTQKQNIADMLSKNRRNFNGEGNPSSKLTEEAVRYAKSKKFSPKEKIEFCVLHNITLSSFYNIEKGRKWAHVK